MADIPTLKALVICKPEPPFYCSRAIDFLWDLPLFLQNRGDMPSASMNFTIVISVIGTISIQSSPEFKSQGNWIFENEYFNSSPFTNFMSVLRKRLNSATNQYGDFKLSLCSRGFSAVDGDGWIIARSLYNLQKAGPIRAEWEDGWPPVPDWRKVLWPCRDSKTIFHVLIQ